MKVKTFFFESDFNSFAENHEIIDAILVKSKEPEHYMIVCLYKESV